MNSGAWDFGDFPYGLEALVMPPVPGTPAAPSQPQPHPQRPQPLVTVPDGDPELISREVRLLTGAVPTLVTDAAPVHGLAPAPAYDQLFWFRWITGHQATFALWRLMGGLLDSTAGAAGRAEEGPDAAAVNALEAYVHAYCALLLYSGSSPRRVYQSLIRPVMFLQHRGFSGTWAPDFAQVRRLLRGRPLPWTHGERAAGLRAAVDAHREVHDSVAARLVPSGRSLLQQSIAETPVRPSERTAVLYDNFFLTLRGPVEDRDVVVQLLRRLRAVALDLSVNGLYPLGRDADDGEAPVVAAAERRVGISLSAAAEHAAGLLRQERPAA